MWSRFLRLYLIIGVLFASAGVPALAHVHGGGTVHALEMLDAHHSSTNGAADDEPTTSDDPDQVAHHHHCLTGTAVAAPRLSNVVLHEGAAVYPASIRSMTSLTGPPPTEPPSA